MKQKKIFLIFILTFSTKLLAISDKHIGSQRFVEFTDNKKPWAINVKNARNPSMASNFSFADTNYSLRAKVAVFSTGPGERYHNAKANNFMANYTQAAAKVEVRSLEFINNSVLDSVASYENDDQDYETPLGFKESKMAAAQAGEKANRYIGVQILTPKIGVIQTVDSEAAFKAAYDQILFGAAEEALFKEDQKSSVSYFNQKISEYENEKSKQLVGKDYQKKGVLRTKLSADNFRDFFAFKAKVFKKHLDNFPNQESSIENCRNNTHAGEDQLATFNFIMSEYEMNIYQFEVPTPQVDWCEQYVFDEKSYLLRNQHIPEILRKIVKDSEEISRGLDGISKTLADRSLSLQKHYAAILNSPAWKKLKNIELASKECGDCLGPARREALKVLSHGKARKNIDESELQKLAYVESIIHNGKLPQELKEDSEIKSLVASLGAVPILTAGGEEEKEGESNALKSTILNKRAGVTLPKNVELSKNAKKPELNSLRSPGSFGLNHSKRRGIYNRGNDGVLRGPSGRAINGYEHKKEQNLFEIISIRYEKSFHMDTGI